MNSSTVRTMRLAISITTFALALCLTAVGHAQSDNSKPEAIRPFRVNVSDEAVADLRRRLTATRWPDKETVADRSQGVQLAKLQELVRYWASSYDWRKAEAKLNALPQFTTHIDGIDVH